MKARRHALLAPSSAERWMQCPGSVQLIEEEELESPASAASMEGTRAHDLLERGLQALMQGRATLRDPGFARAMQNWAYEVGAEEDDTPSAVIYALDVINQMCSSASPGTETVTLHSESFYSLEWAGVPGLDGGTADVVLIESGAAGVQEVSVIDYKHGVGVVVEPYFNPQLMLYAAGALQAFDGQIDAGRDLPLNLCIIQPRARRGEPVKIWQTTTSKLWGWFTGDLLPAARLAVSGEGELLPSRDACRFCPARDLCPAR